jgi:hypothetical protein
MSHSHSRSRRAAAFALGVLALAGCASSSTDSPPPPTAGTGPEIPATIRAEEVVGRWGLASYHKDTDRPRTEAAARNTCNQAVAINRGPNGGVMMYLADNPQLQELRLRGGPGGKNYIGPPGEPAGGPQDREFVTFDGRIMILRWMDPDVAARYGSSVYVRCATPGTPTARRKTT